MTKGNPVQFDPLQFTRIIIGKLHQNLLELQDSRVTFKAKMKVLYCIVVLRPR